MLLITILIFRLEVFRNVLKRQRTLTHGFLPNARNARAACASECAITVRYWSRVIYCAPLQYDEIERVVWLQVNQFFMLCMNNPKDCTA